MPSRGVEADGQFVQFSCGSLLSTNVPAASVLRDVVIDAWSNVTNSLSYTSISQHKFTSYCVEVHTPTSVDDTCPRRSSRDEHQSHTRNVRIGIQTNLMTAQDFYEHRRLKLIDVRHDVSSMGRINERLFV